MAKQNLIAQVQSMHRKIQEQIDYHVEQAEILRGLLGGAVIKPTSGRQKRATAPKKATKKKGRIRRSADDLMALAQKVTKHITAAGSEGVGAGDIIKKYGDLKPSVKQFIKKYAPDFKHKVKGDKQFSRYHAA